MEQILNFRKLADGITNSQGKQITNIYRSADVSNASEADINMLLDLGCQTIIDLRSDEEINQLINSDSIEVHNIDIIGNGNQNNLEQFSVIDLEQIMIDLYQTKFIETDGFKQELKLIESLAGKPFLFHCTAGKDRTGITGAILMYILGFDRESIINEYLKIDETLVNAIMLKAHNKFESDGIDVDLSGLRAVASVDLKFIDGYITNVLKEYQTIDNYLEQKLGITAESRKQLQSYYLR